MSTAPGTVAHAPTGEGWRAALELGFERRNGRSVLARRRRFGPLAVQRSFYPEGDLCHVYLLHPPGGVVGGDRLDVTVTVGRGAEALITTPGAAKYYRSAGPAAHLRQHVSVGGGASLEWLPHENILFSGTELRAQTRIDLHPGARFFGWELHCLGRPAGGRAFDEGSAGFRLELWRDGRPLLLEYLRLTAARIGHPAQLRGHPVVATLLATPADAALLAALRERLGDDPAMACAATLLADLLVVRVLGGSTERVRRLLGDAWSAVREAVIGRAPCPPRIWAT
ncbi:MAG: urease accessory protein UreD [Gammaproteobacteria bacterium]